MPLILAIETATEACSVALVQDGRLLAEHTEIAPNIHAIKLTGFIGQVVQKAGRTYADLDGIAVSKGPGSYTGLRIGVATAKGMCYALDKPLLAVNTLEAMAYQAILAKWAIPADKSVLFCPMIDARRMEVYSAFYDAALQEIKATSADILDEESYAEFFTNYHLVFLGNGAFKCKTLESFVNQGSIIDDFHCKAVPVALLAEQKFLKGQPEDVAYFEPFYLKDFVVGVKKQA